MDLYAYNKQRHLTNTNMDFETKGDSSPLRKPCIVTKLLGEKKNLLQK